MKKIAIVTLNGYFNYGNRLQNYALQEVLNSLGFDVQTLRIIRDKRKNKYKFYFREIKRWGTRPIRTYYEKQRHSIFVEFSSRYIAETKTIYYLDDDLSKLNSYFDYFIVGSDQVWNPNMNKVSPLFFLEFADTSKRIAYAPSFGISELPYEVIPSYKKWIDAIPYLSVREDDGAKIIKYLTGRDVSVLVDPTLLLTKKEWLNIARAASNKPTKEYLLMYFLGQVSEDCQKQINEVANSKGLKIINLGDIKEREIYCTGPSEFIDYINNCSILCTDSFHGVVFAIIMRKPFIVYERKGIESMYSRINTILDKFDLNERKAKNIKELGNVFDINFSHTIPILKREREKAIGFLKQALIKG